MAKKTKYVRTIRITTNPKKHSCSPKNMVAVVIENIEPKYEDCIVIQVSGRDPEDFHPGHLKYITKKEYFIKSLQGPDEID